MTTTQTQPAGVTSANAAIRTLPPVAVADRVSFDRLVRVEFRKLVDTRAGMVLMAIAVLGSVAVAAGVALLYRQFSDALSTTAWAAPSNFVALPVNILVPVVVILLFSQEWGQRTTLTTFAIEPRRGRVLAAKGVVAVLISLLGWLWAQGLSALTSVIGAGLADRSVDWHTDAQQLAGLLAGFLLSNGMAAAFGLLLMNSAAAIVVFLAIPQVTGALVLAGDKVQAVMNWIDLNTASVVLYANEPPHLGWWKLATAVGLWVLVPGAIGVWRNLTREAK
ncbi:hypothetical protein ACSDQ9_09415 [Aestuariimicrobium soli]|uniref:hypothetical protein n=1 Tax=Aestuariimicrobium soli TaxID=2035834 RepID=UPI003EBADFEC